MYLLTSYFEEMFYFIHIWIILTIYIKIKIKEINKMEVCMKKLYSALLAPLLSASILTACSETNVNGKKDVEFYSSEDEAFENAKKESTGIQDIIGESK
jgi:hypothetical protein